MNDRSYLQYCETYQVQRNQKVGWKLLPSVEMWALHSEIEADINASFQLIVRNYFRSPADIFFNIKNYSHNNNRMIIECINKYINCIHADYKRAHYHVMCVNSIS